ncbi:AraC family transcriptional regulator [Veronia pacifica]|uniref:HTH araC/xylS-type domain-containing protein n=1 Tax=Veronia pacifica TaxID=1080227 RepID=A0A1C3EMQ3_9GAMM|nr:AraC family transcriptional regulator [Veronia pacifica]ODA34516.1 hypothetical protein A8L45_05980 [Veronia pacifica]
MDNLDNSKKEMRFPVSYLHPVKSLCEAQGIDFISMLKDKYNLDEDILNQRDAFISAYHFRLNLEQISRCVENNPRGQYQFVEALPLDTHGFVGLAAMSSASIKQAAGVTLRYLNQVMPAMRLSVNETSQFAELNLGLAANFDKYNSLLIEAVACAVFNIARLTNLDYATTHVEFSHQKLHFTEISKIFPKANVKMGCEKDRMLLPIELYNTPIYTSSSKTQMMLTSILRSQQKTSDIQQTTTEKTLCIIEQRFDSMLPSSVEDVSAALEISTRSLSRHLKEEKTSFKRIYSDFRLKQAKHMLQESGSSIASVSQRLHFSGDSSFSRFIKKQTGMSPSDLKRQLASK